MSDGAAGLEYLPDVRLVHVTHALVGASLHSLWLVLYLFSVCSIHPSIHACGCRVSVCGVVCVPSGRRLMHACASHTHEKEKTSQAKIPAHALWFCAKVRASDDDCTWVSLRSFRLSASFTN